MLDAGADGHHNSPCSQTWLVRLSHPAKRFGGPIRLKDIVFFPRENPTMKATTLSLLALLLVFGLVLTSAADDKAKPTTLKGSLVCGKCTLKLTDKCSNVLVVEKEGKKTNFFLDDEGRKAKYHKKSCPPNSKQAATVTGVRLIQNPFVISTGCWGFS